MKTPSFIIKNRMKPALLSFFCVVAVVHGAEKQAGAATQWQFILSYDLSGIVLESASVIPTMKKKAKTPGLIGAPSIIVYDVEWLDAEDAVLFQSQLTIPWGERSAMGEFPGEGGEEIIYPQAGAVAVLVDGPLEDAEVVRIRLSPRSKNILDPSRGKAAAEDPSVFDTGTQVLAFPPPAFDSLKAGADGPQSSSKVWDSGPDENRLVFVILGDGYLQSDLDAGTFSNDVSNFITGLFSTSPWDAYSNAINFYQIDVVSNEQGADYEDAAPTNGGTTVVTYFDAKFWASNIERLLTISSSGKTKAATAANTYIGAGMWDERLVLVNSSKYGGSGGSVAVASTHNSSASIMIHEMGHSFAGLEDEYDSGGSGSCFSVRPNVDCGDNFPSVKWDLWVEAGTPIPTPETFQYNSVVGAFEGAKYLPVGAWRPMLNCKMKSLGSAYCSVCKETHITELFDRVSLIDSTDPANAVVIIPGTSSVNVAVSPLDLADNVYTWSLNGVPLLGQTASVCTLSSNQVIHGSKTLMVSVTHTTLLVRSETIDANFTWTVTAADSDGDGIPDYWEFTHGLNAGTNDANMDPDNDNQNNYEEFLADTSPFDGTDFLKISDLFTDGPNNIQVPSSSNRVYTLDFSPTVIAPSWSTIISNQSGNGATLTLIHSNVSSTSGVYRVLSGLPE